MTRRKKKKIFISALVGGVLLMGGFGYSHYEKNKVEGISISQRLEDLEYLHERVQSTYMSNQNYDQAYQTAKEEMKKSKSQVAYFNVLYKYVASICDPYSMPFTDCELVDYYYYYSKQGDPYAFVDMMTDEKTLSWYGWTLEEIKELDLDFPPNFSTNKSGESFNYLDLEEGKVGYLKVYNMNYRVGKEKQMVEHLNQIYGDMEGKEKIIIDIRGIHAFDDVFWKKEMLTPLICGNKAMEETYLLKSEKNKAYYERMGFDFEKVKKDDLKDVQSPYKEMASFIAKKEISINGTRKSPLKADVYLLVDEGTRGEAARFAHFAKVTDFATVVGRETATMYNAYLPSIFKLEESGMIVGIYDLVFLTPEGKDSLYSGLKPDIEIEDHESKIGALDRGILQIIEMKK